MRDAVLRGTALGLTALLGGGPLICQTAASTPERESPAATQVTAQFWGERGMLVEILGLERWTPAMLHDSVRLRARGQTLTSRNLPATLRDKLGFPDALTETLPGDSALNVLVVLLEPKDSARMRRRTIVGDTTTNRAPWPALRDLARMKTTWLADVLVPLIYARTVGRSPMVTVQLRSDSTAVREVWTLLEAHGAEQDFSTARQLLATAPNVYDRLAALAIIANFERDDRAWHAVVGALLDPDERVRIFADHLLQAFREHASRHVDWRAATKDLHAILDGSALFALPHVLDMLVASGAGPDLAASLLRNGGHAVLMLAGASNPVVRRPSYRFLRAVSGGKVFDEGPGYWQAWIEEFGS